MKETLSSVPPPLVERPVSAIFRSRIMAALATGLNFLLLNLALVIVSVPVVTLPIAIYAAVRSTRSLEGGRRGPRGERVPRDTAVAGVFRAWVVVGVPLAAIAVGVEEVHYFFSTTEVC